MTELTHDQKLQRAAEMLTAKPARLIQMILVKAMIGVVDGSVEAVKEAEAKIDALEAENARLTKLLRGANQVFTENERLREILARALAQMRTQRRIDRAEFPSESEVEIASELK